MATIEVEAVNETTCRVTVGGRTTTTHTVTVSPETLSSLAGGDATMETLVKASFEFLLQREDNTMILRQFDLLVIGQYFPEYEGIIRERLAG